MNAFQPSGPAYLCLCLCLASVPLQPHPFLPAPLSYLYPHLQLLIANYEWKALRLFAVLNMSGQRPLQEVVVVLECDIAAVKMLVVAVCVDEQHLPLLFDDVFHDIEDGLHMRVVVDLIAVVCS